MAVSKRLRFEILRRDNHTCRYCGLSAPATLLRVDHVVPVTLGGSDDPTNLVTACEPCNTGKSSVPVDAPLVADVSADALRLARALREVAAIRAQELSGKAAIVEWFEALWHNWHYGRNKVRIPLPDGPEGVLRFIDAGLSEVEIEDFVRVAMRATHIPPSKTWAYFCGCCWRRIRENVDMAAQLMSAEGGADG